MEEKKRKNFDSKLLSLLHEVVNKRINDIASVLETLIPASFTEAS